MVTETSRIGLPLQLDSRMTLLDALREYLDLVSRKKACSQGCSRVEILSKEVRESHALQGFKIGKSGVRLSEVALGPMTFGEDWGWGASPDVSARMLDLVADAFDLPVFATGPIAEGRLTPTNHNKRPLVDRLSDGGARRSGGRDGTRRTRHVRHLPRTDPAICRSHSPP
jgi:hypothetical protein